MDGAVLYHQICHSAFDDSVYRLGVAAADIGIEQRPGAVWKRVVAAINDLTSTEPTGKAH
jgi:hypothetical protein